MMQLVKIIDGQPIPYTYERFRKDNPFTSYGIHPSSSQLKEQDVYKVMVEVEPAEITGFKIVLASLPTFKDGAWVLCYSHVALNEDEVREFRNQELSKTDWMAVSDRTLTNSELAYRQALRDIPQQESFPDNITWPTKPE